MGWFTGFRLYVVIAGLLALLGFSMQIAYWKHEAEKVPGLATEVSQLHADITGLKSSLARQQKENDDASQAYLDEVHRQQELNRDRDGDPVRLRCYTGPVVLPAADPAPYSPAPATAAARLLPRPAGVDPAPGRAVDIDVAQLRRLADEADRVSAQTRAILNLKGDDDGSGAR